MKALLTIILLLAFGACVWGDTPTPEQIAEWKEAAENGNVDAQYNLSVMYEYGRGVPEDDKEALKWLMKSAEQGNPLAQFKLGYWYYVGQGVPKDFKESAKWWLIAAANGDEDAKEVKADLAELMTKEQIAKAQDLSREMLKANPKWMGD